MFVVSVYPIANKKCTVKILLQALKLQARKIFTSFEKYDNSNWYNHSYRIKYQDSSGLNFFIGLAISKKYGII